MADPRLYTLLKHADAAKRKAAIQALARSKDPEAIPYLERVVDDDDDASIRDLADKAITYIQRNNIDNSEPPQMEHKPASVVSSGSILDQYTDEPQSGFTRVSPADEERARRLLGSALDFNMRDQNAKAVKAVVEAFKINPNLKDDAYARGVAATATGLHVGEAVERVMDGSALTLFDPKSKAPKVKRDIGGSPIGELPTRDSDGREAGEELDVSFASAMLDLAIYGLVNAVLVGGAVFLLIYVILGSLPASLMRQELAPNVPYTFGDLVTMFNTVGVALLLFYSVLYGVSQMIALFLQTAVIHWAATTFIKGEGTFSELLHRFSVFYTLITPLALILPFAGGFIVGAMSSNSTQAFNDGQNIGSIINLGLSIYAIWGSSVRIGKTYKFGTGNGCLSLLVGTIMLGVLCCFLIFGLSYFLSGSLMSMVPSP